VVARSAPLPQERVRELEQTVENLAKARFGRPWQADYGAEVDLGSYVVARPRNWVRRLLSPHAALEVWLGPEGQILKQRVQASAIVNRTKKNNRWVKRFLSDRRAQAGATLGITWALQHLGVSPMHATLVAGGLFSAIGVAQHNQQKAFKAQVNETMTAFLAHAESAPLHQGAMIQSMPESDILESVPRGIARPTAAGANQRSRAQIADRPVDRTHRKTLRALRDLRDRLDDL
jgi:hypothetical protein